MRGGDYGAGGRKGKGPAVRAISDGEKFSKKRRGVGGIKTLHGITCTTRKKREKARPMQSPRACLHLGPWNQIAQKGDVRKRGSVAESFERETRSGRHQPRV